MYGIKKLTDINAVSGNEKSLRMYLKDVLTPYADSVTTDTMGNLIAYKKGSAPSGKTVVFSAHMDEVGFIVTDITDDGFLKFKSVGGIDERIMLSQKVLVGDNALPGVVGIKAVHLQSPTERKSVVRQKDMYIDIGALDKEDALKYVSKGDYVAFDSPYRQLGGGVIKAKALDDRVGCALMCELIKTQYKEDIYYCFNVQEEVGVRGATVLARRLKADVAIILEATTSSDIAGVKPHQYATVLGKGPVISIMDKGSISDRELNKFICSTADRAGIKYQFKKSGMGGNDARAYQTASKPCKTAVISLPCRYIHSPVSCCKQSDIDEMLKLCKAVAEGINEF